MLDTNFVGDISMGCRCKNSVAKWAAIFGAEAGIALPFLGRNFARESRLRPPPVLFLGRKVALATRRNCCVNSTVIASAAKQSRGHSTAPGLLRRKGSSQ